jgi:predicted PurR-regulated permease PerM
MVNTNNWQILMLLPSQSNSALTKTLGWMQILFISGLILYLGKILFVPLLFGLLFAMMLFPICKKMEKKGISRSIAIAILLFFILILFVILIWLLVVEVSSFIADLPLVNQKLANLFPAFNNWIELSFGISKVEQANWFQKLGFDFSNDISTFLKGLLNATVSTILMLVMIPIYTALFLYHRSSFVRFLEEIIGPKYKNQLHEILNESIISYFNFIKGNFYVYCIVGILNSIGLLVLGIKHAILYGMLTSFMMVIPYVGIFISASIPVSIALVTKDSIWYPIGVILIFVFIQYLESNVLFPAIVGMQLNLSTWATLVAIVGGVLFWGIPGMVLVTPFLAIIKIISDHIPSWRAVNILLNRKEEML